MKLVIPMAGMGKRMRPHTLTIPKPLIPVGGKPIVQRLVEEIKSVLNEDIDEIGFVIGDFGKEIEEKLLKIASDVGSKGKIFYQIDPKGTAHAILCADEILSGKVIVAYADTLFKAEFEMDDTKDGIIWAHKVDNPSSFGVVKLDNNNHIEGFHEKPNEFISDLAIIGIYYFKDGEYLKNELNFLLDQDIKTGGEYGITDALQNMMNKGTRFSVDMVDEWLDCGNKDATVYTNQRILELHKNEKLISDSLINNNSLIIEPCFIDDDVKITNSIIGPHVSIGAGTEIKDSIIKNSIIQTDSRISNIIIDNSMIGKFVEINGVCEDLSVGDYNKII